MASLTTSAPGPHALQLSHHLTDRRGLCRHPSRAICFRRSVCGQQRMRRVSSSIFGTLTSSMRQGAQGPLDGLNPLDVAVEGLLGFQDLVIERDPVGHLGGVNQVLRVPQAAW